MATLIGYNLSAVTYATATNTTPVLGGGKGFSVGARVNTPDGKEWVFVHADSAVAQYDVVGVPHDGSFVAASFSTTTAPTGQEIGVAAFALASGDYGWVQVKGDCRINVLGSCVKNIILWSTSTAGALDDATASNYAVLGLQILSTNPTASATNMEGFINYPTVLLRPGTA
jgi:hypothetical protein